MTASPSAADRTRQQAERLLVEHPEWRPLLDLWAAVRERAAGPDWAAVRVELAAERSAKAPLLAGATAAIPVELAEQWARHVAGAAGIALPAGFDGLALLEAGIAQDAERMETLAAQAGADAGSLATVAQASAVPLLRGARARFGGLLGDPWHGGYCPVCGAWAAIAESRGLERARRLRCTRCAADWAFPQFRCVYCGSADHGQLGALVPETEGAARRVETCGMCKGYLKTLATLRAWSADEIALADLGSIGLDLAALDYGYERPAAPGFPLGMRVLGID